MKNSILLLTGRGAASAVKQLIDSTPMPLRVHVCNIDVAAFLSVELVLDELSNADLKNISMIIVPGGIDGDFSVIKEKIGIPCFKGPINVADIPYVLNHIIESDMRLSEKIPADELLEGEIRKNIIEELKKAYSPGDGYTLKIGKNKPVFLGAGIMHVVSEIPNAPLLTDLQIQDTTKHYVDSDASIIDIGMIYGKDYSKEIPRLIEAVRSVTDIPVSIDSLNPKEIDTAINSGADLILSLDFTNYETFVTRDIPAVIIPRNEYGIPDGIGKRIKLIEKLIIKLESGGFKKYIVDLILNPPNLGLVNSITAFDSFRKKHSKIPMMYGCGNVTELMDADSNGVNALLAAAASESGMDLLFTTEASNKTKGAVKELSTAAKMMYLAKKRNQPPKDIGVDLLCLKDKIGIKIVRDPREEKIDEVRVVEDKEPVLEDSEFRISLLDRIEVVYYRNKKPRIRFSGISASGLYKEILSRGLVENNAHAAYLGVELGKAEIALKLKKNYVQDRDLF